MRETDTDIYKYRANYSIYLNRKAETEKEISKERHTDIHIYRIRRYRDTVVTKEKDRDKNLEGETEIYIYRINKVRGSLYAIKQHMASISSSRIWEFIRVLCFY